MSTVTAAKRQFVILFILRMFFYFSVTALILIHPGITVNFDRIGAMLWFLIIPLMALIAFFPAPALLLRKRCLIALIFLLPLSIIAGGITFGTLQVFTAGIVSFTITFLLFNQTLLTVPNMFVRNAAKLAVLEPFFLAWVCLRLLALSRSGEEIAGQSTALTQFILVWTIVVFLLHCVVIYFCLFPKGAARSAKEGIVFFSAAAAALIIVLAVLPADFVRNTVIENLVPDRIPAMTGEDSDFGIPREGQGRRAGRRTLPSGEGSENRLRGIPEHNWLNMPGRGRGDGTAENRQHLVKIVASDREPVYMGNSIRGQLDPVKGFIESADEPFNRLTNQRFFVSWHNNEPGFDAGRRRQEVFSLSTLSQKYFPWQPNVIDPTILNEGAGPLRYIHQVESNTHFGDPLLLVNVPSRPLNAFEELIFAPYLDINLEDDDLEIFTALLNNALQVWNDNRINFIFENRYLAEIFSGREIPYEESLTESIDLEIFLRPINEQLETILAILTFFSRFQYDLNFYDDHSIASLREFLTENTIGDCVEFSNALALLGRIAGIPSRVVTGFLAAESLQTPAHLQGLANLQNRIPVLQGFPFDHLFMVTNLHSHSWTQFYIPNFGWLDFEATLFAIPPEGASDFNTWDVVIPMINEDRLFSAVRQFPWYAVLRAAVILLSLTLIGAYLLRYGRELFLAVRSRKGGRKGARALYLLLLARLAADGKPIKPASKTAGEYCELFDKIKEDEKREENFRAFAELYSQLRWRELNDEENKKCFDNLKKEYKNILNAARKGIGRRFIRIISLRGLAYL